jgi:hypothetical protein
MTAPLVSRGPVGLIAAIFAGGASVAFLLAALLHADTPLVGLAYFAALPLYVVGLGAGALAGIVAPAAGTLTLYLTQPPNFAVLYAIAYGVPAVVLTGMAMRYRLGADGRPVWSSEGKILTAITLYPCLLFVTAAAAAATHPGGLLDITQQAFNQMGGQFAAKFDADQAEVFHRAMANAAKIAPALVAYTWIIVAILSLAGAQNILRQRQWNLRDDFSLIRVHVPTWLIYAVAATGLAGVLAPAPFDYIGRNLAMILGLPFFFVGLAVLHAWAATVKRSIFILIAFYIALFFLPWIALFAAALGVVDQWADFRQRIANKPTA